MTVKNKERVELILDVTGIDAVDVTGVGCEFDGTKCAVVLNFNGEAQCVLQFTDLRSAFHYFIDMTDACLRIAKELGIDLSGGRDERDRDTRYSYVKAGGDTP